MNELIEKTPTTDEEAIEIVEGIRDCYVMRRWEPDSGRIAALNHVLRTFADTVAKEMDENGESGGPFCLLCDADVTRPHFCTGTVNRRTAA